MARRRNIELGTRQLAALLLTLLLGATACDTAPLGVVSGDMIVSPTVGGEAVPGAQPLLQISAGADDAASLVVNYVRTFESSDVQLELWDADGETVAVRSLGAETQRFADLDAGTYRLLVLEQEHINDSGTGAALAGQRMVLSDDFFVERGAVRSVTCNDAGCTVS